MRRAKTDVILILRIMKSVALLYRDYGRRKFTYNTQMKHQILVAKRLYKSCLIDRIFEYSLT